GAAGRCDREFPRRLRATAAGVLGGEDRGRASLPPCAAWGGGRTRATRGRNPRARDRAGDGPRFAVSRHCQCWHVSAIVGPRYWGETGVWRASRRASADGRRTAAAGGCGGTRGRDA